MRLPWDKDLGILAGPTHTNPDEYLDHWLEAAAKARLRPRTFGEYSGQLERDGELIFTDGLSKPVALHSVVKCHFKPVLERAGLPQAVRLYDLRHTHAALLLIAGVHPKIVSEWLGHSSIQITLDTYSHVLPGMQKESAAKLDAMLFAPDENGTEPAYN